ncbi:MAG: hypothetical protein AAF327_09870 [Cyanobacteria bacterium P01_A01_bin.37]
MYTRHNHLENLALDYEHDWAYEGLSIEQDILDEIARTKIVLCADTATAVLENCSYLYVEPEYFGALSIGQRRLYDILLCMQDASVYAVTTIGKLAQMMDLNHPMACGTRFENLQSLGAIAGFKG